MTVKPNTWHFRLANFYGMGNFWRRTTLCGYLWHFMFGVLLCAFGIFLSVLAGYFLLLAPLFWVVLCIADGHLYAMQIDAAMGFMVWVIGIGALSVVFYLTWREQENKSLIPIPAPVREAYRGWKEKYCPIVEIAE